MKIHNAYLNEICNFFIDSGYSDAHIVNSYKADIEIPSFDIKVQVFEGGWDQDETTELFIGSEYSDGFSWRLLESDYVFFLAPKRYYLIDSHSLLEFILNNNFHQTHRVTPKKRPESIVIKIRLPWFAFGLQPDIKIFSRFADSETGIKEYEQFPSFDIGCGAECPVGSTVD